MLRNGRTPVLGAGDLVIDSHGPLGKPNFTALIVHDPGRADPGLAFCLARLAEDPTAPTPIGIFRDVERAVYGREGRVPPETAGEGELGELLVAGDTWTVG